jgi:predicted lysophospholipase L1 biosynthesis ABC-type transport system permease subunit
VRQSLRMLARDWRSGELRVLAVALVIAVASVSSVAFLGDRVSRAIARDANQLLGADLCCFPTVRGTGISPGKSVLPACRARKA